MKTVNKSAPNVIYLLSFIFYIFGALYYGRVMFYALCRIPTIDFIIHSFPESKLYHYLSSPFIRLVIFIICLLIMVTAVVLYIIGFRKRGPRYITTAIISFILLLMPIMQKVTEIQELYPLIYHVDLKHELLFGFALKYYYLLKYLLCGLALVLLVISLFLDRPKKKQ